MKVATERKVKEIRARAKDLKSSYIREIRNLENKDASPEEKEVSRVSGMVIREGRWLVKIAKKFIDRHELDVDAQDQKALTSADNFFAKLADVHSDEVSKNHFIFALPAEFILHLEYISAMILKFDGQARAQIAQIELDEAGEDDAIQDEIDAEMTS